MKKNLFRASTLQELINRNLKYPNKLLKIKKKIQMTFSILASGLGYTNASQFCDFNDFTIMDGSVYYDYLHYLAPILEKIADRLCKEKLEIALKTKKLIVGFDGGWAHKRDANQLIGILIDLITGLIISFQIVHHGNENSIRVISSSKHSKTMEKDSLEKILDDIDITSLDEVEFIHDCDISADSLVSKSWPSASIKYDPNHFSRTQYSIIDSYCNGDNFLKGLNERIKKFYSSLLHDRTIDIETKTQKWKEMVNHFIETENWDKENFSETIENLNDLINELMSTFSKVDPIFSTNICESFHHSRALIATKDIAWRLSWRLRAFISVIRWNDVNFVDTIYKELFLYEKNDSIATRRRKKREAQKLIEKTEEFRKNKAIKKNIRKNKYSNKKNEKHSHGYSSENKKVIKCRNKINKSQFPKEFSKVQKLILEAIASQSLEDKKFVSFVKIKSYFIKYMKNQNENYSNVMRLIKSQLTRLMNKNYIIKKANSYAFFKESGIEDYFQINLS